jgi:hypothetical protein
MGPDYSRLRPLCRFQAKSFSLQSEKQVVFFCIPLHLAKHQILHANLNNKIRKNERERYETENAAGSFYKFEVLIHPDDQINVSSA